MTRRNKPKNDGLAKKIWFVADVMATIILLDVIATIIRLFICKQEPKYSTLSFPGAIASDLSVNQHVINSYYSVDCVHHIGCLERPVRILLDVSKQPSNVCCQTIFVKLKSIIIKF